MTSPFLSSHIAHIKAISDDDIPYVTAHNAAVDSEDNEEKVRIFTECIQLRPKTYNAWLGRAVALRSLGRFEEAIADLLVLSRHYPNFHGTYFHLGMIYVAQERYEDAVPILKSAVQMEATDIATWEGYAEALYGAHMTEECAAARHNAHTLQVLRGVWPYPPVHIRDVNAVAPEALWEVGRVQPQRNGALDRFCTNHCIKQRKRYTDLVLGANQISGYTYGWFRGIRDAWNCVEAMWLEREESGIRLGNTYDEHSKHALSLFDSDSIIKEMWKTDKLGGTLKEHTRNAIPILKKRSEETGVFQTGDATRNFRDIPALRAFLKRDLVPEERGRMTWRKCGHVSVLPRSICERLRRLWDLMDEFIQKVDASLLKYNA